MACFNSCTSVSAFPRCGTFALPDNASEATWSSGNEMEWDLLELRILYVFKTAGYMWIGINKNIYGKNQNQNQQSCQNHHLCSIKTLLVWTFFAVGASRCHPPPLASTATFCERYWIVLDAEQQCQSTHHRAFRRPTPELCEQLYICVYTTCSRIHHITTKLLLLNNILHIPYLNPSC